MAVDTSNTLSSNPLQVTIHPLPDNGGQGQFWSGDAPSFKDILDTINPLQHLPVISTLYQKLTGDVPSSGANIVGGGLIGGPLGLLSAVFNEIVKTQTGKDIGGNILAMINGESSSTQTAQNTVTTGAPTPTNKAAYNAYMQMQSTPS